MKIKKCFSIVFLFNKILSMDTLITTDYFSEQPNIIRKKFIFPLLNDCSTPKEERDTLLSIGLVSKKSYEQINCVFFIKDTIKLLSKKWNTTDYDTALAINTPGSHHYNNLNSLFYLKITKNKYKDYNREKLNKLLSQGADINTRSKDFGLTPLITAVIFHKKKIVLNLIDHGADIKEKINKKYVREYSMLYNQSILDCYYSKIICFIHNMKQITKSKRTLYAQIYSYYLSKAIRDALKIDYLLEISGGKVHKRFNPMPLTALQKIFDTRPNLEAITRIIMNKKNKSS